MTAMGIATVLLFHSVVAGELPEAYAGAPARPTVGRTLAQSVPPPQAWPYPYRRWYVPLDVIDCADDDCSPRNDNRERPWRPVSLSLSAGFAYSAGADVAIGGSGGAFGLRLGAGLVDRLSLAVALEGTRSRRGDQDESETAALLGLQWYPLPFLYFRAAVGAGVVSYANPGADASYTGNGSDVLHPVLSTALGLELGDSAGIAFGLEGVSTWMYVPGENWNSVQINFVLSFF